MIVIESSEMINCYCLKKELYYSKDRNSSSSSTGVSPQCGLITPSFGVKSNGSMPMCPAPARPVPRAHPKDEDSLVQMAEHYPAGTRTPMCGHCNKVIR